MTTANTKKVLLPIFKLVLTSNIILSAIGCCEIYLVWYPFLSKLASYKYVHWRLFVDFLCKKILILANICESNLKTSQESDFYRAMLCIRGTSHGPVSVCVRVRLSQVDVLLKRQNV